MNIMSFCFESQNCNGWPQLRFIIDNDVHLEHQISQNSERVDLSIDLLPGLHSLDIERFGKRIPDNIVFKDGQILQDQMICLTDIYIDDIKLPDMIKYSGIFKYEDQVISGGLWWGPNGIWNLPFATPLIDWVINIKQKNQHAVDLLDYQSRSVLAAQLTDFEKLLTDAS